MILRSRNACLIAMACASWSFSQAAYAAEGQPQSAQIGAPALQAPAAQQTLVVSYIAALDPVAKDAANLDAPRLSFSYKGCSICKIRPDAIGVQISKTALWIPYVVRELQLRRPDLRVVLDPLTIALDETGKLELRSTIEATLAPNRLFFLAYTQPNVGMHGETNGPATRARTLVAYMFKPTAPSGAASSVLSWDDLKASLAKEKYRMGDIRESNWNQMYLMSPTQVDELGTPLSTAVDEGLKTVSDEASVDLAETNAYRQILGNAAASASDTDVQGLFNAELKFRALQTKSLLNFYSAGDLHDSLLKQMKAEDAAAKKRNNSQLLMLGAMVATMGAAAPVVLGADAAVLSGMAMQDKAGGEENAAFEVLNQQQVSVTTKVATSDRTITAASVTELRVAFRQLLMHMRSTTEATPSAPPGHRRSGGKRPKT